VRILGGILGVIAFAGLADGDIQVALACGFFSWLCFSAAEDEAPAAHATASSPPPKTSVPPQPSPRTRDLEVSIQKGSMGEDPDSPTVWHVRLRGSVPQHNRRLSLWTSVLCETGACFTPSSRYHEDTTPAYLHKTIIGQRSGWTTWSRVGVVIPGILQPARGGQQTVRIVTRLIDSRNPPPLEFGLISNENHPGLIWTQITERRHTFSGKGYEETAEEGPHSRALAIKLAVAIAFADTGGFTEEEASVIQKWMTLQLSHYEGQPGPRKTLKKLLNDALKEAHALGNIGKQGRKRLAHGLGEIGEQTDHYIALALCIDVMVSDRVADSNELQAIREIAEGLSLDSANVQELLHTRMTQLDLDTEQGSAEDFLGIDPKWDKKKICKSIRTQFQTANSDLMVLTEQVEKKNVQRQLDALAVLHKKYKC
jgi:uncharacterized tellurite resistance protein B-like protein